MSMGRWPRAGVPWAGGDVPAGTVVIGVVQENDTNKTVGPFTPANKLFTNGNILTATWAAAAGTTTISKAYLRCSGWDGGNVKVCLYGSDNALIASTAGVNIVYGESATVEFTFSSPPTITKGSTYRLGFIYDTAYFASVTYTSETNNMEHNESGTYASPPASIASRTVYEALGTWAIWAAV
jgi:hypothetical protein